jgi:ParB family chromosome partitioning protein
MSIFIYKVLTPLLQIELARRPTMALATMMNRLIPVVFHKHYLCSYAEHAVKIDALISRDKLLNEADDMESSIPWKELEVERAKWIAMLPKNVNALLQWLLEQEAELIANLFAFCVAATVEGISAADRAHPINALADLMQVDMPYYWSPTHASYLDHVSKARITNVVSDAVSPEAAADLQAIKKGDAAAAAELGLADRGWLPEVLTNRETPKVHSYGADDGEAADEEASDRANDEADVAEARDES